MKLNLTKEQKDVLDVFITEIVKAKNEFSDNDYNSDIEFYEMLVYAYRNAEAHLKAD